MLGVVAGALLSGAGLSRAATLTVRQDGTGNYTTIQTAVNAMAPGDTCLVGPGTYPERVRFPSGKSGHAGALTTVKAATNGTVDTWGFDTANCNYVHIEGFNITTSLSGIIDGSGIAIRSSNVQVVSNYIHDVHYFGISITGTSNYVAGNHIYQPGIGINIDGTGSLVEGNEVERLIKYPELDDADFSRFFGSYHVIRGNYFHGTQAAEIGSAHVDGFQTFDNGGSTAQHIRIDGNRVEDFFNEGLMVTAQTMANSFDILFCNNTIRGASSWGSCAAWSIQDVRVYNNTFINSAGIDFELQASGQIRNNLFYNPSWFQVLGNVTGGNNLFYHPGGSVSGLFTGDMVNQDPKLANVANLDFHLLTGSPAIDRGATLSEVSTDFSGAPRPQGAGWDIGAFEFGAASQVVSSQLAGSHAQSGSFAFALMGQPGRTYSIESSSNLVQWTAVTNCTLTNGSAQISRPMTGARLFFRSKLLP